MKTKKLILIALTFLFVSCSTTSYTLKGVYDIKNYTETTTSYDEVWDNVIDFFANNNIPISCIEKASGIIVAGEVTEYLPYVTSENKDGFIHNQNAHFVFPYKKNNLGGLVKYAFNVRVKQLKNNLTYVRVNVTNIYGYRYDYKKKQYNSVPDFDCYSTGVLEKKLLSLFK